METAWSIVARIAGFFVGLTLVISLMLAPLPAAAAIFFVAGDWLDPSSPWFMGFLVSVFLIQGVCSFYLGVLLARLYLRIWPLEASGARRTVVIVVHVALTFMAGALLLALSALGTSGDQSLLGLIAAIALCVLGWTVTLMVGSAITAWLHIRPGFYRNESQVVVLRRFSGFADRTIVSEILKTADGSSRTILVASPHSKSGNWDPFVWVFSGFRLLHPLKSLPVQLRMEDQGWEQCVAALVEAASGVILEVTERSDSILTEIEIVEKHADRRDVLWLVEEGSESVGTGTSSGQAGSHGHLVEYERQWSIGGLALKILFFFTAAGLFVWLALSLLGWTSIVQVSAAVGVLFLVPGALLVSRPTIDRTAKSEIREFRRRLESGPGRKRDSGDMAEVTVSDYESRLESERESYARCMNVHELPEIYHYWADKHLLPMFLPFGFTGPEDFFVKYALDRCRNPSGDHSRLLSIGSGNGELESMIARRLVAEGLENFSFDCLEINPDMVERARLDARQSGLGDRFNFLVEDVNAWTPSGRPYDVVIANQSLHHVVELEHLFDAVKHALSGDGVFLTSDMIGRNGHQRWPEALALVNEFWQELPAGYRYNQQLRREEPEYINHDCSTSGFEGIRAQDILPLLVQKFEFELFIPFGNVIFVFVDRAFGHNFDTAAAWDKGFIDRVHSADEAHFLDGGLKPTSMLAAMTLDSKETRTRHDRLTPEFCIRDSRPRPGTLHG